MGCPLGAETASLEAPPVQVPPVQVPPGLPRTGDTSPDHLGGVFRINQRIQTTIVLSFNGLYPRTMVLRRIFTLRIFTRDFCSFLHYTTSSTVLLRVFEGEFNPKETLRAIGGASHGGERYWGLYPYRDPLPPGPPVRYKNGSLGYPKHDVHRTATSGQTPHGPPLA